jgi:uncharacterized protein (DUF2147 family)
MDMTSWIRTGCAAAAALSFSSLMFAQASSPVGRWRSFDDKTGQPKAIIEITEVNGELQGKIDRVFSPPAPNLNPVCDQCPGDRKGKPVLGMQILWGMKKDGNEYGGGRIYDLDAGKEFRGKVKLVDGGKKLDVRGSVGPFGRTVTWTRE